MKILVRQGFKATMKFNIENILSKEDLLSLFSKTSIDVPLKTEGRSNEDTEKYSICHLLSTLSFENSLSFPLSLQHIDKPDFILDINGRLIGIEITESASTDYNKCCALAERENPNAIIDMSLFKWNTPERTTKEHKVIINSNKLYGEGWEGDSAEKEWAYYMNDVISTKVEKLNIGYSELSEYWLSIYDNLPLPNIDIEKAVCFLLSNFSESWKNKRSFSKIFIEKEPLIIEIYNNKYFNHKINYIW